VTRGYASGTLGCTAVTCQYDETACVPTEDCGNGDIDAGEQCDGTNLNNQTCATQGFDGGTLLCTGGCQFQTSGCHRCGDGAVNGTEEWLGPSPGAGSLLQRRGSLRPDHQRLVPVLEYWSTNRSNWSHGNVDRHRDDRVGRCRRNESVHSLRRPAVVRPKLSDPI
jgi:hypothetical protein